MKKVYLSVLFLFILFGCTNNEEDLIPTQSNNQLTIIASKLNSPWSITKYQDTFFITERDGAIVKVENVEVTRQQVQLEKNLSDAAEAGLLGLELAPDFATSQKAFAYYTYEDESGQFNRIVTLKLEENTWRETSVLIDKIPSGNVHHGGRLKIGPDGKLYATTGDAANAPIAQDIQSLGGKILRMNLEGSIPGDNPFPNSYVYSYGHRNPQGLAWATDGTLYASEHGNSRNDEINKIEAGHNYGWPEIEGLQEKDGMELPIFTAGDRTIWAPSGMAYKDEKLYVAMLRGEALKMFDLKTEEEKDIITNLGRIRDVYIEGDDLYFITNNTDGRGNPMKDDDKLYKMVVSK